MSSLCYLYRLTVARAIDNRYFSNIETLPIGSDPNDRPCRCPLRDSHDPPLGIPDLQSTGSNPLSDGVLICKGWTAQEEEEEEEEEFHAGFFLIMNSPMTVLCLERLPRIGSV